MDESLLCRNDDCKFNKNKNRCIRTQVLIGKSKICLDFEPREDAQKQHG